MILPEPGLAISVQGVTRRFGGVTALRDVSVEIPAGERRAVIGPNGAGKSTLLRVIGGDFPPTSGQIMLDGRSAGGLGTERVAGLGVARSFQASSLFPEDTVLDNVLLAVTARTQRRGLWRPLGSRGPALECAQRALERMDLLARAHTPAGALSHGEARQLELAMVLAQRPRALLLDEPLAGLGAHERAQVGALLHALPRGLTILLIEHDLPFCMSFADRITVLSGGNHLATGTPQAIRADGRVQAVYVGPAPERRERPPTTPTPHTAPALDVQHLSAGYGGAPAVNGVSVHASPGEIVAVLGRNGMGKSTLLTTVMGWRRPTTGRVVVAGRDVTNLDPAAVSARGVALVPQGRRMLAGLTVDEELRVAARPGTWTPARVYGIFPRLRERQRSSSTTLSGGEQQLLAIGRALVHNPRVLLLDEPTEGLSPPMVTAVRDVLLNLRESGGAVVIAEHTLDMALAVADRVCVLDHGAVVYSGTAADLAGDRALAQDLLGV